MAGAFAHRRQAPADRGALLDEMLDASERASVDSSSPLPSARAEKRLSRVCASPPSRCLLAFSLWIANHFIAADHGDRTRAQVQELAMRGLAASRAHA